MRTIEQLEILSSEEFSAVSKNEMILWNLKQLEKEILELDSQGKQFTDSCLGSTFMFKEECGFVYIGLGKRGRNLVRRVLDHL